MNAPNVLRAPINSDAYRFAVATIIGDIERLAGKTLVDIADDIDVSLGTISNAKNRKTDLSAEFLARLGQFYGGAYLNPYFALFQSQAAPIEKRPSKDILPIMTKVAHKVAAARDPDGPGGAVEVPQEKLGYLSDLKALLQTAGTLVSHIEETVG